MKKWIPALLLLCAIPAAAEVVEVKGRRTSLDLANTQLLQQECNPSLCIGDVYYDGDNEYLVFQYRGTYLHRCGVPEDVVDEWVNSNNLKKYYEKNIKSEYDCAGKPLPY
jgi:hypothetical protein